LPSEPLHKSAFTATELIFATLAK